ncbi:MAG TPA: amidohydrolase family protein [Blastocatellia bacterium]|nr:amidohydrolase family protein [Blastocatellia bacterium]
MKRLSLFLLIALLLPRPMAVSAVETFEVILRNGTILDGTGAKGYRADIAVRNGFIARIGKLRDVRAAIELDVSGLVVAPGFINLHSHATPVGVRTAVNMLTQGVTTEIINADGAGALDITQQLANFSAQGLAVNLGAYVGFNSVWAAVVGQADRRPTAEEIQKMRDLLTTNLQQGAWGVSAGLDYKPGYFAKRDEVIAVMQAATPWRTNFPNHDRLMPETNFSSLKAIGETIEIGEKTNVMPVVTHMKVQGHEQGKAAEAVAMMRAASQRGHETVADIYPYLAGQTGLGALFVPAWAVEGGMAEMRKRFADPTLRPRIAAEIETAIKARILKPENIYVASHQRQFTEYMRERNAGAGETIISILEKESPSAILTFGSEADLIELLKYSGSAVSCDCGAAVASPSMHPRAFGTFPRVLGHYVREAKALTLEDAVRKMTGLPASILGLADRGFLAVGMAADIAVFDPATIIDHATYEQPTLVSTGVRHVLVNGRLELRDGKSTGEQGGHVLHRTADLPSRPMRLQTTRSLSVQAKDFTVKLTQAANGKARGTVRFVEGGKEFRLVEAGLLQAHGKWASFTARARTKDAAEQSVLVVVDGGNPMNAQATMRVQWEDGRRLETKLEPRAYQIKSQ